MNPAPSAPFLGKNGATGGERMSTEDDKVFAESPVWGDLATSAFVQNSHLFKSLDDAGRRKVCMSGKVVHFHPGEVIVREGDPGDSFFLVKNGAVRVVTARDDQDIELATLGRGAFFGEVAVLTGMLRTATVIAEGDVEAIRFDKPDIEQVLEAYPRVKKLLEAVMAGRAQDTIGKTVGH
jgi:CRP-like cAMP-binding protein